MRRYLLVALVLLAAAPPAQAGFGPLGEDTRISFAGLDGDGTTNAGSAAIARNTTDGGAFVVWVAGTVLADNAEVYGQRLTDTGAPVGQAVRLSSMGPEGSTQYGAESPDVAYDPASNEYLVIWVGDDDTPPLVNDEDEVFGQRVSAAGAEVGADDFRISEQGADGEVNSHVSAPSVAADPTSGEYLVAWSGDIGTTTDQEIWAQRLSATGAELGGSDFQVSDMGGSPPDDDYEAYAPDVAPAADGFLVVWYGTQKGPPFATGELEVWGQRLSAAGAPVGADDFRISTQGADGDTAADARLPSVAYAPALGEHLVAWEGTIGGTTDVEIWAQRLDGTGASVGGGNFQVSDASDPGGQVQTSQSAAAVFDAVAGEWLVTWSGDDDTTEPTPFGEVEVFGQRLGAGGGAVGADDFRVSTMGPDGDATFRGSAPAIAPDAQRGGAMVVWTGIDSVPGPNETEVFGRALGLPAPVLTGVTPASPADDNAPRLSGTAADPVDVFAAAGCSGEPSVTGADLTAGVSLSVADNSTTSFSAIARGDGRTSLCSNAVDYAEVTAPPATTPSPSPSPAPTVAPTDRRRRPIEIVRVRRRAKALRLTLRCPADALACANGTAVLRKGKRRLGAATFAISAGETARLRLVLNRRARKLRARKAVRAKLVLTVPGPRQVTRRKIRLPRVRP